jgi:hypothetical protein
LHDEFLQSEAKDLALPMEVADGEGTQSEILRFAQNDSAFIFLPFADFFTPSHPRDLCVTRE